METRSFLRNKYWVLRHGKSIPNEKGIIVASKENGTLPEYQLAEEGIKQARLAGEQFLKVLKENNIPQENVRICYSPFSRTSHTARVAASVMNLSLESPQCKYAEIWAVDEEDPFKPPEGGECVNDVALRLSKAMVDIESEFQGCMILIVSHGDPLQILQTIVKAAAKVQACPNYRDLASRLQSVRRHSILSQHRQNALLTGELRALA